MLSAGVFLTPALVSCGTDNKTTADTAATDTDTTGSAASDSTNVATKGALTAVGLQLYTLRDQISKDVKGVLAKVAEAGYQTVETYGYSKKDGFWGMDAKAFGELLKANNLTSPSGHYGFDQILADNNQEVLNSYIEAAKATGQSFITIPYLGDNLRKSADGYKKLAAQINKAAETVNKSDLKLAYHNHNFEFQPQGDTTGYEILLKETDPNLVKMELDLYWAVNAGKDPVQMFQQNPGRFAMWHVKDMDKNNRDLNTEIGSGSIDYKNIFAKGASEVQYIFVEQENFAQGMDPYKSIAQSAAYVKNTLL